MAKLTIINAHGGWIGRWPSLEGVGQRSLDEAIVFLTDVVKLSMGIYGTDRSRVSQVLLKLRSLLLRLLRGSIRHSGIIAGSVDIVESLHVRPLASLIWFPSYER
ncbi:hypothetical protein CO683_13215 [Bradyrhizobium ottawaense]|nr:hypothetical protein CO683_13215 [Bradyrhizobium ottawaense]